MSERPIFFASPLERIRAERRRRQRELWVSVAVLIALVVMVVWMISVLRAGFFTGGNGENVGLNSESLFSPVSNLGLAIAPVTWGSVLGLGVFMVLLVGVLMLRGWADYLDNAQFCDELRAQEKAKREAKLNLHDPFAGITDGLNGDELHRILTTVAAEAREIRRLLVRLDVDSDERREQEIAHLAKRMAVLIRCVESLCERLQPCIDEKEGAL